MLYQQSHPIRAKHPPTIHGHAMIPSFHGASQSLHKMRSEAGWRRRAGRPVSQKVGRANEDRRDG